VDSNHDLTNRLVSYLYFDRLKIKEQPMFTKIKINRMPKL